MILKKIKVKNFRSLKDFELDLNDELSIIVGKNNSGKTSVLMILDKMINASKFSWDDINLERHKEIYSLIKDFNPNITSSEKYPIDAIKLQLYIEYDEKDSYVNIQKFMMDLNPKNNIIIIEISYIIDIKKVRELNEFIKTKNKHGETSEERFTYFTKYIRKNFQKFFSITRRARGFDIESFKETQEISEELDVSDIEKVIKVVGIRADRSVSNDEKNRVLSKLTSDYYNSSKNIKNKTEIVFSELEEQIEEYDNTLSELYNGEDGVFSGLKTAVNRYGGVGDGINISINSSISEKDLLANNTILSYTQGNSRSLPETYNGLGYLNLMGIIFEIETKLKQICENPADINILYIEEPEAHTHPQLQYIFIRNIKKQLEEKKENYLKQKVFQTIITTHSSHIVSESNFLDIIYFRKGENQVIAKNFKLLELEYDKDDKKWFKFVKQYITLHRSELFFADKVICIEGDTERILMPMMMRKIDEESNKKGLPLLSQNISIIETGAHAHVFNKLFSFLGIKVLIITDIDPCTSNGNGNNIACDPSEATGTSNGTLKKFFSYQDSSDLTFDKLRTMKYEEKEKSGVRVAYQIPEDGQIYQPATFEDSFIILNKKFIVENKEGFYLYGSLKRFEESDLDDPYKFSQSKINKKPAFASSILYFDAVRDENSETWKVPAYIREGLEWLR